MLITHLAAVIGLAVYLAVPHAKISEAGRTLFSWSVLASALAWIGHHVP